MRWTAEQEHVLFEHGHKGPEYCRREIFARYSVLRSVDATKRHAARIGASMERYEVCPRCERPARSLNRISGLCRECQLKVLIAEQEEKRRQLDERFREAEMQRRYDTVRKANNRRAKKDGKELKSNVV